MAETLLQCDDLLWARFVAVCRERDETPGAILRDLVRLEGQRRERRKARSAEGIDVRLLVRLWLLVAEALVVSESRGELHAALRKRGLRFVLSGGGLTLVDAETREPLAKSRQVGPAYMALVCRFRTGFPGQPQQGIAALALARPLSNP